MADSSAADWLRQEMQRQFDMINDGDARRHAEAVHQRRVPADRETLLAFPEARITYVRCEVAKQTGAARPAGCQ